MATATASKGNRRPGRPAKTKPIPCNFGVVGNRKKGNRIGVAISRDHVDLDRADELFTNAQLSVTLQCDPLAKEDAKGQQVADYGKSKLVDCNFTGDVHGFSVRSDVVRFSLLTPTDVSIDRLAEFSFRAGTIFAERTGDAESDDTGEN